MLSPTEIYENFDAFAQQKLVGGEFGLALMEAVGAPRATITKLKDEAATGSFSWTRMLRFETVALGDADRTLERMKAGAASLHVGRAVLQRLDQVLGHAPEPIARVMPAEAVVVRCVFPEPLGTRHAGAGGHGSEGRSRRASAVPAAAPRDEPPA